MQKNEFGKLRLSEFVKLGDKDGQTTKQLFLIPKVRTQKFVPTSWAVRAGQSRRANASMQHDMPICGLFCVFTALQQQYVSV